MTHTNYMRIIADQCDHCEGFRYRKDCDRFRPEYDQECTCADYTQSKGEPDDEMGVVTSASTGGDDEIFYYSLDPSKNKRG